MENKPKRYCKCCGREDNLTRYKDMTLCKKHYEQYINYNGIFLDENPRDKEDLNEIIVMENHAEIVLYDEFEEEIKERAIIDLEDVDLVKNVRWNKKRKCVVGEILNREIPLQNYILNTDDKVSFVSKDAFDCRRINLFLVKNTKKKRSNMTVSKKNKNKVIVEFVGKSKHQVTSSAIMVSYPIANDKYERLLIEFGQSQTNKSLYEEHIGNKEVVQCVTNYDDVKAAFVLHAHL